jgi:hypothetical protein
MVRLGDDLLPIVRLADDIVRLPDHLSQIVAQPDDCPGVYVHTWRFDCASRQGFVAMSHVHDLAVGDAGRARDPARIWRFVARRVT